MNLHRRPDRAVVAVARFQDDRRPSRADAAQEDQAIANIDGATDDWILSYHLGYWQTDGGNGIALFVTERRIEPVDVCGGEEVLRGGVLPVNLAGVLRGEDRAQHPQLARAARRSHGIRSQHGRGANWTVRFRVHGA